MDWVAIAVGAGSGLFAGYATNKLALKMLFWPRRPVLGFGVFPANQARMAEEVGHTVATQVLTYESMQAHLTSAALKARIESEIRGGVDGVIFRRYDTVDDLARLLVPDDSEREAISTRLASMTGAWVSSLAADPDLRSRLGTWLAGALETRADSTLSQILPTTAHALIGKLANHLVGVVRDHGPARIKASYRAWLNSEAPLRQWIGRIDPSVSDAIASEAGELAASFACSLADDAKTDRIVALVAAQIDAALQGNTGGFLGSIRAHLLRNGWQFVQDDALVRLRTQLPRLVGELAAYVKEDEARALISSQVQQLMDRALDMPVRDLWAKCPSPVQVSLFRLLDNALESPHLWSLVRTQVDAAVHALMRMRLGQLLPIQASPSSEQSGGAAPLILPGIRLVVVVAAPDSARRLRGLLGFRSNADDGPIGLVFGGASADFSGANKGTAARSGFAAAPSSSIASGVWGVAVVDGSEPFSSVEALVERADALIVDIQAVQSGGWMARYPWHQRQAALTPALLVRTGTPTATEIAGRWRDAPVSNDEKLAALRVLGENPTRAAYQTLTVEALDAVAALRAGVAAVAPDPSTLALREAIEAAATAKAASLVGLTAMEAWLKAVLREVVPPTRSAAEVGASPDLTAGTPYRSLVDTMADYVTPERAQHWSQAAWATARSWPVGVPAERISEAEAQELTRSIASRLFDLLEENAARVAQSIDVAAMARDRVAALDPTEVEEAVGRMSMGAFWWLEVLGGLFGLVAAAALAVLYQWSPAAGAVSVVVLSLASIGLMVQARFRPSRSSGG